MQVCTSVPRLMLAVSARTAVSSMRELMHKTYTDSLGILTITSNVKYQLQLIGTQFYPQLSVIAHNYDIDVL